MSPAGFRIVARLRDGGVRRGFTSDFRPGRETFTLMRPSGGFDRILLSATKAVFFVKTFEGDPNHVHSNVFDGEPKVGRCVWVEFLDGERLAGRAPSIREQNGGFFLFPNDSRCNFARAWVVMASTKEVLFDEEAEVAAVDHEPPPPPSTGQGRVEPDSWEDGTEPGTDDPVHAAPDASSRSGDAGSGSAGSGSTEASASADDDGSPAPRAGEPEKSTPPPSGPRRPHSRADLFLGDW
jgi:hypothetical protein